MSDRFHGCVYLTHCRLRLIRLWPMILTILRTELIIIFSLNIEPRGTNPTIMITSRTVKDE